jgi:osmotically-inducible protein OsmY
MKRLFLSIGAASKRHFTPKRLSPRVSEARTAVALSLVALGVCLGLINTLSETPKAVLDQSGLHGYSSFQSHPKEASTRSRDTSVPNRSPSTERADAAITQAVLEEIMQPANGFVNLDIMVKTVHGRVTLAGTVKSETQKKLVIAAVERVAGTGNIEDQLETSGNINAARL